jgi:hypothetical protein
LIICPNTTFAVYMICFVKEYGQGQEFSLLITDEKPPAESIKRYAKELGIQFINEIDFGTYYEELFIGSYHGFGGHKLLLKSVKFRFLTYFSDGMRNGMFAFPSIDQRLIRLIYWGFFLDEESFFSQINRAAIASIQVVSFHALQSVWRDLLNKEINSALPTFVPGDLLLSMRYWGQDDVYYPIKTEITLLDYLEDEFSPKRDIRRVIVRPHPLANTQFDLNEIEVRFKDRFQVISWDDFLGETNSQIEILTPEALVWLNVLSPSFFFGFDSSLNVLVASMWPETEIIWPEYEKYSKIFSRSLSSSLVREQTAWMRMCAFQDSAEASEILEYKTPGYAIATVIASMIMNSQQVMLTSTDGLVAERDGLVAERDGLVAERDGLVAERDGLVNSTIWKASKGIRKVVSWIKNKG